MIIFEINSVPYGSTGRIMFQIRETGERHGHTVYTSASFTKSRGEVFPKNYYRIGTVFGKFLHIQIAKRNGWHGMYSKTATRKLIRKLKKVNPDVIHLHNLHGWYLNYQLFTEYLKLSGKPIVWTLHDCWALTGLCPHFTMIKCEEWRDECHDCPIHRGYPGGGSDRSRELHRKKKEWFMGIPNMTIVTPSQWLGKLVKESYLKDYPVMTINNGINLDIFKPTGGSFREKHRITDEQCMVLGVAFEWGEKKGLDVFIELAKTLGEKYRVVLVGTNEGIDELLPDNIVSIHCTQDQEELAEIYTAADVFVNPTREDTFPTVNIEALACGTPVVTFRTGGSPECIEDGCGAVVDCDDIIAVRKYVSTVKNDTISRWEICVKAAEKYDMNKKYDEYIALYETITKERK